jgi:hypothetical protein
VNTTGFNPGSLVSMPNSVALGGSFFKQFPAKFPASREFKGGDRFDLRDDAAGKAKSGELV